MPIPLNPFGANPPKAVRFSGWKKAKPTTMKNTMMPSFRITIAVLKRADSFTPRTRRMVMSPTMSTAGRLKTIGMPATWGAVSTAVAR